MQTPYDFGAEDARVVYVKTVAVANLPHDVQAQADGRAYIYAVHDGEGQQLALVSERALAFALARQHDYQPVAVH